MIDPIGDRLQLALAGTFVNGLWFNRGPTSPVNPYGVFTYWWSKEHFLAGEAVDQNAMVQIDIYDSTGSGAANLANAVEIAMRAHSIDHSPTMFTAHHVRRQSPPPDPDTGLRRIMLEYSFWFRP